MSDFVEIVFVKLPHETREIAMLEMFRKNGFGKPFVLRNVSGFRGLVMPRPVVSYLQDHETIPLITPPHNRRVCRVLEHSRTAISMIFAHVSNSYMGALLVEFPNLPCNEFFKPGT